MQPDHRKFLRSAMLIRWGVGSNFEWPPCSLALELILLEELDRHTNLIRELFLHLAAGLADDRLIGKVFIASHHAPSCRFVEALR